MKSRTFKVMEPMSTHAGAHLRFRGQWLREAGFHPGAAVILTSPSPGVIELRVAGPAQLRALDFTDACAALDHANLNVDGQQSRCDACGTANITFVTQRRASRKSAAKITQIKAFTPAAWAKAKGK